MGLGRGVGLAGFALRFCTGAKGNARKGEEIAHLAGIDKIRCAAGQLGAAAIRRDDHGFNPLRPHLRPL